MNKRLEIAIEKVKRLPEDRQDVAAECLTTIIEQETPRYVLTDEQLARVDQSLSEADRGNFASQTEVDALYKKFGHESALHANGSSGFRVHFRVHH